MFSRLAVCVRFQVHRLLEVENVQPSRRSLRCRKNSPTHRTENGATLRGSPAVGNVGTPPTMVVLLWCPFKRHKHWVPSKDSLRQPFKKTHPGPSKYQLENGLGDQF